MLGSSESPRTQYRANPLYEPPSRPLKKLPSVMGIRPVRHEVQRFVEVVVAGLGTQGHAAPMSLESRMRL